MKRKTIPFLLFTIFLLTACGGRTTPTEIVPMVTATSEFTPTPLPPTPTTLPMALIVNGEGVLLSDYQAELARLVQADTELNITTTPEEQKNQVLQNYTDLLLLTQAAAQGGFSVDDATVQARIDALADEIGGVDQLNAWKAANGYTDDSFFIEEKREIIANWQMTQIYNTVPTTADQVHARQILFQDEPNANAAYQKLKEGTDFTELATQYDPTLGGDLGWFATGTLTQPEVDAAAFALQPGQYSTVIKSAIGYHIIYVIDRDPEHPLSIEGRKILQKAALTKWLDDARAVSSIQILAL